MGITIAATITIIITITATADTDRSALREEHRHWCDGLRGGSPSHRETVAELRALLLRVARHELGRRRHQIGGIGGPELEDLADQAANDAVVKVIEKLEGFRGASRFTTWACKFAIFEVSAKVARHQWRGLSATAAASAGVAVGTLYNYFQDRSALVRALLETRDMKVA